MAGTRSDVVRSLRPVSVAMQDRGTRVVCALPVRALAGIIALVVLGFGVLGYLEDSRIELSLFDLDGEGKPAAAFSALLLGSAGLVCWLIRSKDGARRRWLVLGCFFVFMAFDEALTLHETAARLTGLPWTVQYIPIMAFGGVAWLLTLQVMWQRRLTGPVASWLLGAVAWLAAVALEEVQSNPTEGRVEAYSILATFEECLEMTGNALWLLAAMAVFRAIVACRPAGPDHLADGQG